MGNNFKWTSHAGMLIGNSRGDTNTCLIRKHCLTDNTPNLKDKKDQIPEAKGLLFIDFGFRIKVIFWLGQTIM